MKKKVIAMLAVVMAIAMLVGCGSTDIKDIKLDNYVTIGEYKGLIVTVDDAVVDEEEWDATVQQLYLESCPAELGIKDREVKVGDTVNLDYVGKQDGVAFSGGTATGDLLTIGSGQFIDGFEDGLVGVMPGDVVDLELTFPEDYASAEMAGQTVIFTVNVNYIIPEEITDEAAAGMGFENVTTVEELRQFVYDYLMAVAVQNRNSVIENSVMTSFMANCVFEKMPKALVQEAKENVKANLEATAAQYSLDAETFAAYAYGVELEEYLESSAIDSVQQALALHAIAEAEGLIISDEELQADLQEAAELEGYATVEELLGENTSLEDYREYYTCARALEFMAENAVISQ